MILPIIILISFIPQTKPAPLSPWILRALDTITTTSAPADSSDQRSTLTIIWTCLATVLICTWVCIHPNIPEPNAGPWRFLVSRIVLLVITLLAPELTIWVAVREWCEVRQLVEDFRRTGEDAQDQYEQQRNALRDDVPTEDPRNQGNSRKKDVLEEDTLEKGVPQKGAPREGALKEDAPQEGVPKEGTPKEEKLQEGTPQEGISQENTPQKNPRREDFQKKDASQFSEWGTVHAHFIHMNGIVLVQQGQPTRVLSFDDLKNHLRERTIEFPTITEDEIKDRSKGDAIAKTLVLLQTIWFITQVIARHQQGLVISVFELITAALAGYTGFIYFFWWNKPLNVERPFRVFYIPSSTQSDESKQEKKDTLTRVAQPNTFIKSLSLFLGELKWSLDCMVKRRDEVVGPSNKELLRLFKDWRAGWEKALTVPNLLLLPIKMEHSYVYVPFISSLLFGVVHCIGWNFQFNTHTELLAWRISCIILMVTTALMPIAMLSIVFVKQIKLGSEEKPGTMVRVVLCMGLVYSFIRLVLLGQALFALRNLPEGSFQVVEWTELIPHIG